MSSYKVDFAEAARGHEEAGDLAGAQPGILPGVRLTVTLERDEAGMLVVECPAIPGCVSQGRTEAEALANIREAIVGCLDVRVEQGLSLTGRTLEV